MNAECYCNFQSNFNVGSCASCFVTIGKDTSRQVAQVELHNFIGYLQQCLQRINVLELQNSFFFSFDIAFLLYRFRFFSLYFVFLLYRFRRFFSLNFVFLLYRFRFISLDFVFLLYRFHFISLDFVFLLYRFRWILFSFRFFLFLSLPVPVICLFVLSASAFH